MACGVVSLVSGSMPLANSTWGESRVCLKYKLGLLRELVDFRDPSPRHQGQTPGHITYSHPAPTGRKGQIKDLEFFRPLLSSLL